MSLGNVYYFQDENKKYHVFSEEPLLNAEGDTLSEAFGVFKMLVKQELGSDFDTSHLGDPSVSS